MALTRRTVIIKQKIFYGAIMFIFLVYVLPKQAQPHPFVIRDTEEAKTEK